MNHSGLGENQCKLRPLDDADMSETENIIDVEVKEMLATFGK